MLLAGGVKMELIIIRPGEFMMGSPDKENGRVPNEGPQHKVKITKPFYMSKYEATQAQWQQVMGNNSQQIQRQR
jgi:formylglycine-generating enzyme required for sulfatase activity